MSTKLAEISHKCFQNNPSSTQIRLNPPPPLLIRDSKLSEKLLRYSHSVPKGNGFLLIVVDKNGVEVRCALYFRLIEISKIYEGKGFCYTINNLLLI